MINSHATTRRPAIRFAGLLAVALLAGACSSDSTAAPSTIAATATSTTALSTTATSATSAESAHETSVAESTPDTTTGVDGAFPVSIPNKFGTTEIASRPERVVSIGYTDGDAILALGVAPVAIREWYGDQPGGLWPWAADSTDPDADIEVLPSDELDFESIAALDPDLIVGISSEITQTEYDTLTEIAPVVASAEEYIQFGTPWDVQQRTIGTALGLADEAESLIDHVTDQLAAVAEDHPDWNGRTGNVAAINADGSSFLYTADDARGRFIADLGFSVPEEVSAAAGDLFYATVSAEQTALLDGDVLIYTTFSAEDRTAVEASPLFTSLDVVAEGRAIYVDETTNAAMSFGTTLSIPFALDVIVPQIEAALAEPAAGEPTTEASTTDGSATAGAIVPGADSEIDAVVTAYSTVFDSSTTFDQKAPFLPDADALRATVEGYDTAGGAVNGIQLVPTAVTIDGDTASITYDVLFAGTAVYNDLSGSAVKIDGAWTVTRDEFCGFMAQARNPCP